MNFRKLSSLAVAVFLSQLVVAGSGHAQNLTLGKIQQSVKVGVTKEKVLEELGSPNMVTGSSADQETWIYDKVSTTT